MGSWAAGLIANGLEAITSSKDKNGGALFATLSSVLRYPIKAIAAFILAPFLAFRIAALAKNPIRRLIAGTGLVLAIFLAWAAGTFLGTMIGALFVGSKFGFVVGAGFLLGTAVSVTLSVAFSILVLNTTAWAFLHLSSEEVISYLKSISE
ncbi:hypothetical protein [Dechloromonas denitrificans]|uniref:hypothetical protein n=1 Tax=Dechloromonas denitrificans TaxID=281362 RepID=UPI001CFA9F39|nr:hypothetical protein [Dechloromonas denitrificans]UCV07203.1 hypothetical protein KI615_17630 [Dechloromonas denitrificans]